MPIEIDTSKLHALCGALVKEGARIGGKALGAMVESALEDVEAKAEEFVRATRKTRGKIRETTRRR